MASGFPAGNSWTPGSCVWQSVVLLMKAPASLVKWMQVRSPIDLWP